ncbi:MAG: hypothetical protein JWM44_3682 [Bacilli bacterium]|nr:hypothetical protein [Bacilli bacterium]
MSYRNPKERNELLTKLKSVCKNEEFSIEVFGDNREIGLLYDYVLTGNNLKQSRKLVKKHEEIYDLALVNGISMSNGDIQELLINGLNQSSTGSNFV